MCSSLYGCSADRCMFAHRTAHTACQEPPWQRCKMRFWNCFAADPAPHLIPVAMMNYGGHPGFSSLNHRLQHNISPRCYTECFGITSSLCALRLCFWHITLLNFTLTVKQIVSITFFFICLPIACNIKVLLSEESYCTAQPSCLISVPWGKACYTNKGQCWLDLVLNTMNTPTPSKTT